MDPERELWQALRWRFTEPDGSEPELRVLGLGAEALVRGWSRVLRGADPLRDDQSIWDERHGRWTPAPQLPEAGALVALGRTAAFRVDVAGVRAPNGERLPDIGVTVADGELALDVRMGPEWTPAAVAGIVGLALELRALDPGARLEPEPRASDAMRRTMAAAIDRWVARRAADDP